MLLDSLVAQRAAGTLVVGRGVPGAWLGRGPITVANFPTTDGHRLHLAITSTGRSVTLTLGGATPGGPVQFELPAFVGNIASASTGRVNQRSGIVTVPARTRTVTVELRGAPAG